MLELRQIRNFVAVAETLSFTRAADRVHLSQPALSRQIQALEAKLGVKLFERDANRVTLTADGEELLVSAVGVLDQVQALVERSQRLKSGTVGRLHVGGTANTIVRLISPTMAAFRANYPNVEFAVSEADNDGLLDLVESGAVHLAVAAFARTRNLAGTRLFAAKLMVAIPPAHRLARVASVELTDIADDKVMVLRRGFLTRRLFDVACAERNVRPQIIMESDSAETIYRLSADGHALGIVSTSARSARGPTRTVPLIVEGAPVAGDVHAVWHSARLRSATSVAFVEALRRQTLRENETATEPFSAPQLRP